MLASQRRAQIAADVRRRGAARVTDLTARFAVSDMTIRRDLELLEAQGRVRKVHGGAVAVGSSADEPGFDAKRGIDTSAKRAIAARAAALVEPRSAIGISAGTTTWMLAEVLAPLPGPLSVVTNSTTVADVLAYPDTETGEKSVILTGGLRTPSAALVGAVADRAIESLHVDQLFLGVHGMDASAGFTTPNLAEAHTNAAFIGRARQLVVLADSTKWSTIGLATIAPLAAADVLITDEYLPAEAREALRDTVGELIIVPVRPESRHPERSPGPQP
jgi:DeoR/GlpR family transcriptional regulator of sugar metabolism